MTEDKKKETKEEIKVPILTKIQNELKAPKNQYNSFGKYKYRNAEDIESAVKPLLEKYGAQLAFDEDIKQVGDRYYIVEIAKYKDSEQTVIVHGHAREALTKKGMDDSQITGAAASYATKYALGKLFLIDDTKDADSQKPQSNGASQPSKKKPTKQELMNYPITFNGTPTNMGILLKHYNDGLSTAVKFANSLQGNEKFVFDSLKAMN